MAENTQNQTGVNSSQAVGQVTIQYGSAKAIGTDGAERVLSPNSQIFMGDHIITGPDGMVSVVFDANQTQLDIGRMSDAFVDQDVIGQDSIAAAEDAAAEVADIQQTLIAGDIEQIIDLPATAAGGGAIGGSGTHGYNKDVSDGDSVLADFGMETTGVTGSFVDPTGGGPVGEDEPIEEEEEEENEEDDRSIDAGDYANIIDEDDLPDGSDLVKEPTTHTGDLSDLDISYPANETGIIDFGSGNSLVLDSSGDSFTIAGISCCGRIRLRY
jgi:hypothetical protein